MLLATGLAIAVAVVALGAYSAVMVRRVLKERAETQRVRDLFSRYVSPTVVDEVLARKDPRLFEGRAGHATMLFCRIWNFALFSEELEPGMTLRYLNEFYAVTGASIQKHRGMIDKFLGDGIMAVFGMPLDDPFQEEHALNAALDIVRLVASMNGRWTTQGRKPIKIGIGISSGKVISGDTGYALRREYTVVGSEVTVASRLQELTEQFGAFILANATTFDPVREQFSGVCIKNIPIRGMRKVTSAYVIRGLARYEKDDKLLLPPPSTFRHTMVAEREAAAAASESAAAANANVPTATGAPAVANGPAGNSRTAPRADDEPPAGWRRKKKKKLRQITQAPDFASQVERDRFEPPAPTPQKTYEKTWIPPAREFKPESAPSRTIDIPELRKSSHEYESAEPALPELPSPPMTYEDGQGPPMQLPP